MGGALLLYFSIIYHKFFRAIMFCLFEILSMTITNLPKNLELKNIKKMWE